MEKKVFKITIKERRRYAHLFRIKYVISCFLHTLTHTRADTEHTETRCSLSATGFSGTREPRERERSLYLCPCPLAETAHCADCRLQIGIASTAFLAQQKDRRAVTKGTAPCASEKHRLNNSVLKWTQERLRLEVPGNTLIQHFLYYINHISLLY